MDKSKSKVRRYSNLIKTINNWPSYLGKKITGFGEYFEFDVKNLGKIKVKKNTLGTFRENFLDNTYLSDFPEAQFNKEKLTVIDVGANIGYFSLSFLAKYPQAKVYGFEPHPYCFTLLEDFHKEFNQFDWEIYNTALAGEKGTLTLNTSTTDGYATMSSIFENVGKQQHFTIEADTLDSFISAHNIDQIDLIKMDCEGSEYPILYGLSEESLSKVDAFCIETHKGKQPDENIDSVVSYLEDKGFTTRSLDEGETGYVSAWKK